MLFEGNFTHQMGEDETHGNSIYNTYFRNYSTGYRLPSWVNAFDGATINDLTGSPQGKPGPLISGRDAALHVLGNLHGKCAGIS